MPWPLGQRHRASPRVDHVLGLVWRGVAGALEGAGGERLPLCLSPRTSAEDQRRPQQWYRHLASGTETPVSLSQVTVTVPSEKSSLSRETEGRKKCPHRLPDEQQPWGQQEADAVQVGPCAGGEWQTSPCLKPGPGRRGSQAPSWPPLLPDTARGGLRAGVVWRPPGALVPKSSCPSRPRQALTTPYLLTGKASVQTVTVKIKIPVSGKSPQ